MKAWREGGVILQRQGSGEGGVSIVNRMGGEKSVNA